MAWGLGGLLAQGDRRLTGYAVRYVCDSCREVILTVVQPDEARLGLDV